VIVAGARRDESSDPHPVLWVLDGAGEVSRIELDGPEAFLWDVSCDGAEACVAAGTDNTFVRLDDVR
jgi:hypothetical protein